MNSGSDFSGKGRGVHDPIDERHWRERLISVKESLEKNRFEVYVAQDLSEAKEIVLEEILPGTGARLISWGDSLTVIDSGLLDDIRSRPDLEFLDTFEKGLSPRELFERRRKALLSDLFITGTNALTRRGQLINLDMVGNRVGGITFGPKHVVVLVGRNKIVPDLEAAMGRIRTYAAPANAIRHQSARTRRWTLPVSRPRPVATGGAR